MPLLTSEQLKLVADAVAAVETRTDAELVTVLAKRADDYRYIPTLWAAIVALLTPAILRLTPLWLDLVDVMAIQLTVFAVFAVLFRIPAVMTRLIPRQRKKRNASQLARVQFLEQNLHHTRAETGILIFVSEFERHVEILVDRGISRHVADEAWQKLIDAFVEKVKAGNSVEGFIDCINGCCDVLAQHVPATDQKNELPNRLVMV
jgi:putative membrane protein